MGVGALALVLATLGLIAATFVGRYGVARLLGVREIGIFGPRRPPAGVSASALRRLAAHAGAPVGAYFVPLALFFLAFRLGGESHATTVIEVMSGMPAEQAGLQDDDRITHVGEEPIADWEAMRSAIKRRPNQPTPVQIQRDGQSRTLEVTPNAEGAIGVKPVMLQKSMGLGPSLARAAIEPLRVVQATLVGIVRIVTGSERASLSGPVAMSHEVGAASERGLAKALYMIAVLAAYVWPGFVILEVLLAAGTWRDRRHHPRELAGRP
jgi:membrane-associated protease RseP (regulator of RpoE activity)